MKLLEIIQIIIIIVTFLVWVAFALAYLLFDKPIDQGVFILTMGVFAFVFGPGVFKGVLGWRNGTKKDNGNGKGAT